VARGHAKRGSLRAARSTRRAANSARRVRARGDARTVTLAVCEDVARLLPPAVGIFFFIIPRLVRISFAALVFMVE